MDASFWHQKWEARETGFHEGAPSARLVEHADRLGLSAGDRVFVPLCGKSRDVGWLLGEGYRVVGAELHEAAVAELFADLGVEPTITARGALREYRAGDLTVFVGDVFDVTAEALGTVDAVYDRAAVVALPDAMRVRYARHVVALTDAADQLVVSFEYDPKAFDGPPFSVDGAALRRLYGDAYDLHLLATHDVPGGRRGTPAHETTWLLQRRED